MADFSFPNKAGFPTSYQDTLTPDFISSLYTDINKTEEQQVGEAQGESVRRGLTGTPFEAGAVGAARQAGGQARQKTLSDFLYNLAGVRENENIIGEQQQYGTSERLGSEQFQASQNALNREFGQEQLASEERRQNQQDIYGLYGAIAGAGGSAVGSYAGYKLAGSKGG